ncbi:MAG: 23S rRNA (uracil(1939)-C(5))-methyltransferase RlmD [Silvanigrellales bacterium]|nr:23S rRNA (uracil(1939)-C(5))-methyltransferase RlmD [Silvanigrellales bacterium]
MLTTTGGNPQAEFVSHEDPCRVLAECQACSLLDLEYRKQLQLKTQDFRALVASKGDIFARVRIMDCTASDVRFGYRHTAKLVVSERRERFFRPAPAGTKATPPKRWLSIGLYQPGSHEVVDIGNCPVQTPHINSIVAHLRGALKTFDISVYDERTRQGDLRYIVIRTAHRTRKTLLTFVTSTAQKAKFTPLARDLMERFSTTLEGVLLHVNGTAGNAIFELNGAVGESMKDVLLSGRRSLEEELCGLKLRVSAESFFQVNPYVAERMYNRIVELADLAQSENALDLYCGVGGISLLLAKQCRRVVGVEETASSIDDAKSNAESNRIPNIDFFQGRAEDVLPVVIAQGVNPRYDVVTLNPSRRGCQPEVLERVAALAPRRIVYMSCFADTLLRDAAALCGKGYKVVVFEPFDMFPGTSHMEVLCVLDRVEPQKG